LNQGEELVKRKLSTALGLAREDPLKESKAGERQTRAPNPDI